MGTVVVDGERCKGCELCVEFCSQKVLRIGARFNSRGYHFPELHCGDGRKCTGCAMCARVCPDVVIEVYR